MHKNLFIYILILFIALSSSAFSQKRTKPLDSTAFQKSLQVKKHSPLKATIYSAILPGLGQIYNKKYWKVPIIYGTIGALGYLANDYNNKYQKYLDAYIAKTDKDETTNTNINLDEKTIGYYKDRYRRNRDLFYILMGLAYVLNIVDASVDAHFFDFDVSEDLSLQLDPTLLNTAPIKNVQQPILGLRCSISF